MRTAAIVGIWLVACGGADGNRDPFGAPAPCTPGEQQACGCPGGGQGAQVCNDAGDRFGACLGCEVGAEGSTATTSSDDGSSTTAAVGTGSSTTDEAASSTGPSPDDGIPDHPPQAMPPAPPPDGSAVVMQNALDYPELLAASCIDTGGNNEFLFEVARRLRAMDDRWGLNWKRGVVGDLSQDVIDYHYGAGVSDESTEVYIIDIIGGHCGDNPQAGWIDVTQATLDGGTVGMWTLAGQDL